MPSAAAPEQATLASRSPATGALLGSVPTADEAVARAAVDSAAAVQPYWAHLPLPDRARYMRRAAQVVIDGLAGLSELIAREQGKPRAEAAALELLPTVDALHWIADHGPAMLRDERLRSRQLYLRGKRHRHLHEPLGVVAVITDPSLPWAGPFLQAAFALMAGNGVVLKPSPATPLVGARIESVLLRAGLPEGLVRTVHGGDEVGNALAGAAGIAKAFFSGGSRAGAAVEAAAARRGTPCVLELGGKDPQLVLADARVAHAVAGAAWAGFANAGQAAAAIERTYVAREAAPRFVDGLVDAARSLRLGDPLDPGTDVGPLVSAEGRDRASELVEDAVARGATLHCGGPTEVSGLEGAPFFAPAVVSGLTPEMRLAREPVPGPVIAVAAVGSEDEAIALANDSAYGLGASVWTRDRARGERIARRLEAGMTWVNDHRYSHGAVQCAWGGTKGSGSGRVHGEPGFRECVEVKLLTSDAGRADRPWWLPYDTSLATAAQAGARLLYGRDEDRLPALRAGARPLASLGRRVVRSALRR